MTVRPPEPPSPAPKLAFPQATPAGTLLDTAMTPTREHEVDIAYALEAVPAVLGVYALALPVSAVDHVEAHPFGVLLRPYTGEALASTHFVLRDASSHAFTASVTYADGDFALSRLFRDGRRLVVEPAERDAARSRFLERTSESIRGRRLEEAAMAAAFLRSFEAGDIGPDVRLSLESGVFEALPDPFPTERLPPATVLVLDDDPATADIVRQLGEVEAVTSRDIWAAIDLATERTFDLVLCGLGFDGHPGWKLSSMLKTARPSLAGRTVVLGLRQGLDALPGSGPKPMLITRPLNADIIRRLIARLRR